MSRDPRLQRCLIKWVSNTVKCDCTAERSLFPQVFDLLRYMLEVDFIETACTQQRGCAAGPGDEIDIV